LGLPDDFDGLIVDFGCALGDAMPVYKSHYPRARLVGVDISPYAIDRCRERYADLAEFICGDESSVPPADVVIASNVFEHLPNHIDVARQFLAKCRDLYITVPYKETPFVTVSHINRYDKSSFVYLGRCECTVFMSEAWASQGIKNIIYNIYFKNTIRWVLNKPLWTRRKQIMFHFHESP